jgi:hypothetical protein
MTREELSFAIFYSLEWDQRIENVWLEISSWRGMSIGATHFYGTLHHPCTCSRFPCPHPISRTDLEHVLTTQEAKELTKLHNDGSLFGPGVYKYKKGDTSRCFETKEEIIKLAIASYQEMFPDRKRLILGSPIYVDGLLLHERKE